MFKKLISSYAESDFSYVAKTVGTLFVLCVVCVALISNNNQLTRELIILGSGFVMLGIFLWIFSLAVSGFNLEQEFFYHGTFALNILLLVGSSAIMYLGLKLWPITVKIDNPIGLITLRELLYMVTTGLLDLIGAGLFGALAPLSNYIKNDIKNRKEKRRVKKIEAAEFSRLILDTASVWPTSSERR